MVLYIHFSHGASLPGIFYPSPPLESWETYVHSSQFAYGKWLILFPTSLSPKSDEPLILLYSYLSYIFQSSTHHMELLFVRMCILSFLQFKISLRADTPCSFLVLPNLCRMRQNYFQTFYSKLREGILAVCKASLESGIKGGSALFEGSL